jgi:glycyl-tRNA synthetase beta chain
VADLLFEIGTEELPSWYVDEGSAALRSLLLERLEAADLPATEVRRIGTPRRLAVIAHGLPARSAERVEARRGPPAAVAFDASGAPTKAAHAFAASNRVDVTALELRETERGSYVYANVPRGGAPAADVLPALLSQVVADLPAPRKMRWADEPTPFLRPVSWMLALLDDEVLEVEAAGVRSGRTTMGHRFLAPEAVKVRSPGVYVEVLRQHWVIADREERRVATFEAVRDSAAAAGLAPYQDEALLDEVADLVEWPFPILGAFDERYLELPDEVLATVMIKHQRFFPTRKETGDGSPGPLARHFVGVSNNRVEDVALVRKGYEQVLGGRLYDARFFWDADRAKSLSQHAWDLSGIAFQKELGSMADKTARVGVAAQLLVDALGIEPGEAEALQRALPVFRADLATDMVYEFPELEGVMARAYALAEGLSPAAADALLGGVLPRSHADDVPATPAGAVLSVADRVDKLVGFFALGKRPSGSADPFALRRDAVAVARIAAAHGWRVPLATLVEAAAAAYRDGPVHVGDDTIAEVTAFVWDRVGALLVDLGAPVQVVRAAVGGSHTVIGAARRTALLRALMERPDFADLMALYKRAANLAKAAEPSGAGEDEGLPEERLRDELFREAEEAPLLAALPAARSGAQALLTAVAVQLPAWDLARAMPSGLAGLDAAVADVVSLKAPLDAFLDGVLVMDEDEGVRRNRLALLSAVVDVLRQLGALAELEGA